LTDSIFPAPKSTRKNPTYQMVCFTSWGKWEAEDGVRYSSHNCPER